MQHRVVAAHREVVDAGPRRQPVLLHRLLARRSAARPRRRRSGCDSAAVSRPPSTQRRQRRPSSPASVSGAGPRRRRRRRAARSRASKRPSSMAPRPRAGATRSANASISSRGDVPLLGDHLGAAELRDLLRRRSARASPSEPANGSAKPNCSPASIAERDRDHAHVLHAAGDDEVRGAADITACAAKCTACWDEPHCRSTVVPGTSSGSPAASQRGAGDVAGLRADRVDAAEHHVVDGARVDARCGRPAP